MVYPEDDLTDLPLRLHAAEVTREQVYLQLHDELPYAIAVETEAWQERDDGSARIDQVVYVQRESQRKIVLGAGGRRIKKIMRAPAPIWKPRWSGGSISSFSLKCVELDDDPERYALGGWIPTPSLHAS